MQAAMENSPVSHQGILMFNLITDPIGVVLSCLSLISFTEMLSAFIL